MSITPRFYRSARQVARCAVIQPLDVPDWRVKGSMRRALDSADRCRHRRVAAKPAVGNELSQTDEAWHVCCSWSRRDASWPPVRVAASSRRTASWATHQHSRAFCCCWASRRPRRPVPRRQAPVSGAYDAAVAGNQKIALALFDAQAAIWRRRQPLAAAHPAQAVDARRDRRRRSRAATAWGQVFQAHEAHRGLSQEKNLGQVVSQVRTANGKRAATAAAAERQTSRTMNGSNPWKLTSGHGAGHGDCS